MKKIIASLASITLGISATLTTTSAWKFNDTYDSNTNPYFENLAKKANNAEDKKMYSHMAQRNPYHQYKTDDPQTIINDITIDHFLVPKNTNPNVNNPQTLATIKKYLQKNNPKLSDNDMKYIELSPGTFSEKLSPSLYSSINVAAVEGSASDFTTIYVKLDSLPTPSKAVNLYNPDLPSTDSLTLEKSYYDDVFLKSLVYNPTNKSVTSSQSKLTDPQDIKDYQAMAKTGNIVQGLSLVNRYLQSNFIKYNKNGIIPTREQLQKNVQQTLITKTPLSDKTASNSGASLSDYIDFKLHWWGFELTLKPKLISEILNEIMQDAIKREAEKLGWDPKDVKTSHGLVTDAFATATATGFGIKFFDLGAKILAAIDSLMATIPAVGEAVDGVISPILIAILGAATLLIVGMLIHALWSNTYKKDSSDSSGIYTHPKTYFEALDNLEKGEFSGTPTMFLPDTRDSGIHMGLTIEYHFVDFWNTHMSIYFTPDIEILPDSLEPSNFSSSLHKPSTITGNANDFTIAVGYNDLANLSDYLTEPETQTLPKLFAAMDWKNVANFKGLTVPDLESLQKTAWQLPNKGYMALIHVIKTNGIYHIAWTNLDNDQDKHSLLEPDGDLTASFLNENNNGSQLLNTFTNQQVYDNIVMRYKWIEANWDEIKTGKQVTEKTAQQYFQDTVLNVNHLNLYQTKLNDVINSMEVMTDVFKNSVAASYLLKPKTKGKAIDSTIMNIYWSNKDPLNPSVQID